ncbi:MAG: hypothetical protein JKY70_00885 [Mucilaginibacter sp.]|nr:hypothetical protein [Mucilaginibacter sp.]
MSGTNILRVSQMNENSLGLLTTSFVNLFTDWPIDNLRTYNSPGQRIILSQVVSEPDDDDEEKDGCDVEVGEGDKTNDEDLPITQGGVA